MATMAMIETGAAAAVAGGVSAALVVGFAARKALVTRSGTRGPLGVLALGLALRATLVGVLATVGGDVGVLSRQPELASSFSSAQSVWEGVFLRRVGHAPHEGEAFHGPLALVMLFDALGMDGAQPERTSAAFIAVDVLLAIAVYAAVEAMTRRGGGGEENNPAEAALVRNTRVNPETGLNERGQIDFLNALPLEQRVPGAPSFAWLDPANAPRFAALVFCANPYSVLACGAVSLSSVGFAGGLLALAAALDGAALTAGAALGLACSVDELQVVLALPVAIQLVRQARSSARGAAEAVIAVATAAALWAALLSVDVADQRDPAQWLDALQRAYGAKYEMRDLSPNLGLWWYFFTEVFSESSAFFLLLFRCIPVMLVVPLAVTLRARPQALGHGMLAVQQLVRPYPELGGVGLILTLVSMHRFSLKRMRGVSGQLIGVVATTCLLPVMRFMWLTAGSGNANYFYFQTLGLQFCLGSLVISFLRATVVRDAFLAAAAAAAAAAAGGPTDARAKQE